MIGYTTLGTVDLDRAKEFYDALFAEIGIARLFADETAAYWGRSAKDTKFAITKPFDGKPATVGNGVMVALRLNNRAEVDAVHRLALSLGAQNEGPAGPRGEGGYYGAYFRDLDGNKLAIFVT